MADAEVQHDGVYADPSLPVKQPGGAKLDSVKEGLAYILTPANTATSLDPKRKKDGNDNDFQAQSVFYNPIQQFNRDLSVLAIKAYSEDLIALRAFKSKAQRKRRDEKRRAHLKTDKTFSAVEDEAKDGGVVIDGNLPADGDTPMLNGGATNNEQSRRSAEAAEALTQLGVANNGKRKAEEALSQVAEEARPTKVLKEGDSGAAFVAQHGINEAQSSGNQNDQPRDLQIGERAASVPPVDNVRKPNFTILDALSATGLRALRYAKEIPAVTSIVANDMSPDATRCIERNVRHNNLEEKISVITGNAIGHMYNFVDLGARNAMPTKEQNRITPTGGKYDVIDLDPYGTAVPFLDAALQALNDGGMLCVTCTDAGVWASCGYPEKTFALYGGTPIKGHHSHEGGLRLIIHAISTTAARYGIAIEPLLSLSIDFYARVFVRIRKSAADVKYLCGKSMLIYSCDSGCGAWKTQYMGRNDKTEGKKGTKITKHGLAQGPSTSAYCGHCGFKTHISGPMYGGPLHNPAFIQAILDDLPQLDRDTYHTLDRIEGILSTALEETSLEGNVDSPTEETKVSREERLVPQLDPAVNDRYPFFFLPSDLAGVLRCQAPAEVVVKGALRHAGYRVARSHTRPGSIRTDAPWSFIWHMMREWVRQKAPVKEGAVKQGTAGFGIMDRPRLTAQAAAARCAEGARALSVSGDNTIANGEPSIEQKPVVFDKKMGRDADRKRLVRYQTNPRANWGPMNRAKKG